MATLFSIFSFIFFKNAFAPRCFLRFPPSNQAATNAARACARCVIVMTAEQNMLVGVKRGIEADRFHEGFLVIELPDEPFQPETIRCAALLSYVHPVNVHLEHLDRL